MTPGLGRGGDVRRRKMKRFVILLVCSLATAGLSGLAAADGFLTKEELKAFFSDRKVDTQTRDGVEMIQHFKPDGTLETFYNRPRNPHYRTTRWWVTDRNMICFENAKGGRFCNRVEKVGDEYRRYRPKGDRPIRSYWRPRL